MTPELGDMWTSYEKTDLFVITANAFIKKAGCLVMGRGIAAEAKKRMPELPKLAGNIIEHGSSYGLVTISQLKIGLFQVKQFWFEKANLDLIQLSTERLTQWIEKNRPNRVDLNFPGIGNGRLDVEQVFPIIETLPDVVRVWTNLPSVHNRVKEMLGSG